MPARSDTICDMVELHSWPKHAVPRDIAVQIRSYIRMQWPFLDGRRNRVWDFPPRNDEPTTLALVDGEILVSHTEVNYRTVEFQSQQLKVAGLSAVFTYPSFRGSGFARQIVSAATDMIRASDATLRCFSAASRWSNSTPPADGHR